MGQNVSKFPSFRRQPPSLLPRENPPEVKSGLTLDHQNYFSANEPFLAIVAAAQADLAVQSFMYLPEPLKI